MKCPIVVVTVAMALLASSGAASVIPVPPVVVLAPPLSYTAQSVDLGGGLQGVVVAGDPARVVVAGWPWLGSPSLVVGPWPNVIQVAPPAVVQPEPEPEPDVAEAPESPEVA